MVSPERRLWSLELAAHAVGRPQRSERGWPWPATARSAPVISPNLEPRCVVVGDNMRFSSDSDRPVPTVTFAFWSPTTSVAQSISMMECIVENNSQVLEPWIESDVRETIATMDTDGQIVGSRCADCGLTAFPASRVCRRCLSPNQLQQALADHGTLYSYSTVHVASGREVPYSIGYIDLADGLRILGPLDIPDDRIACDLLVRLTKGTTKWAFQIDGGQA